MAINISADPAVTRGGLSSTYLSASNRLPFTFTRSASEAALSWAIYASDGTTLLFESRPVPFWSGNDIEVDISGAIQSLISTADDSTEGQEPVATNPYRSANSAYAFKVGFKLYSDPTFTVDSTIWYAVLSVQQALSQGPNLYLFFPAVSGSPLNVVATGKFLSSFLAPRLFWHSTTADPNNGAQVAVFFDTPAYIAPISMAGVAGEIVERLEVDGVTTSSTAMPSPLTAGVFYANSNASDANKLAISNAYEYILSVTLADTTKTAIVERPYTPTRVCFPFYPIKWRNELGGWEVWVFQAIGENNLEIDNGDTYSLPQTSTLALDTGRMKTFTTFARESLAVKATSLSLAEVTALRGIATSPTVLLCVDDFSVPNAQPTNWVNVQVENAQAMIDNFKVLHQFTATFLLPEINTISN